MAQKNSIIIRGNTIKELLEKARDETRKHGQSQKTYRGNRKVLYNVTLVLEHPEEVVDQNPYWNQNDTEWYLNNFVRTNPGPPETPNTDMIFPYTYNWRARQYDNGFGHLLHTIKILIRKNYTDLPFTRKEDIDQLVQETYTDIHPDLLLAVLLWMGRNNLKEFLAFPALLENLVQASRRDLLQDLVNSLNISISLYEPSIPVANNPNIDHNQTLESLPAFLHYQVAPIVSKQQNVVGLEAAHTFRHLAADGSIQLDLAHSIDWGNYITEQTGLPIKRIAFYTQQLFLYTESAQNLPDIQSFLFARTTGYHTKAIDINKLVALKRYNQKAQRILAKF